ncbi:hypothetical protein MTO96_039562 [Rhipicephalus appendiculatus]
MIAPVVSDITGLLSYKVQSIDCRLWKRHVDQIRSQEWHEYSDQPPMVSPTKPVGQEPLLLEPRDHSEEWPTPTEATNTRKEPAPESASSPV